MKVEWIENQTREPVYEAVKRQRATEPKIIEYGDRAAEQKQLVSVREELAGMPVIMIVAPVEQAKQAEAEEKTLGGAFVEWILGGIGLLFWTAGETLESLKKDEL
jgi:hypothetical protein